MLDAEIDCSALSDSIKEAPTRFGGSEIYMVKVSATYILSAIFPAIMIVGLYFFCLTDASTKEFNLKNHSVYYFDILLLGFIANLSLVYKENFCLYLVIKTCVSYTLFCCLMAMHRNSHDVFTKQIVNIYK